MSSSHVTVFKDAKAMIIIPKLPTAIYSVYTICVTDSPRRPTPSSNPHHPHSSY